MSSTLSRDSKTPVRVGITGGIGSGKSLIGKIFKIIGVPVFEADLEAKLLYDNDREVRTALSAILGEDIFPNEGVTDRKKIAAMIFGNRELLDKVNGIVHPAVRKKFADWCAKQDTPYVIQEAAILFESGASSLMDINIHVSAPEEVRIGRVMKRDGVSREEVMMRIVNQWPDEKKQQLADFVILNDGNEFLVTQILDIHNKILNYGKVC